MVRTLKLYGDLASYTKQNEFDVVINSAADADGWLVFDTTRGWGSGNDYRIMLDSDASQSAPVDYGAPTSTGFTMTTRDATNANGEKYIYYAHA